MERLVMFGANHRLLAFLLLVLCTVLTLPGLQLLRIDTGLESLIADTDPDRQAYLRVAEQFGSDNRTLVYVRDAQLWTTTRMASLQRLQESLQSLEQVDRVESILTVRTIRGQGRRLDSHPLLVDAASNQDNVDRARRDALDNPLIVGNYVSADGQATALMVTLRAPGEATDFDATVNAALQQVIAQERDSFAELFQIGPSRINDELQSALYEDLRLLGPVSAGLLVLTILLFLGSVFGAVLPLLSAGLSLAWTFGLMGLLDVPVNILSAMLPSLIVVIGSTEDTHMIASYFHGVARQRAAAPDRPVQRLEATRYMMRRMGVPLFLTILTTALGFGANLVSNIELIRQFALAATCAVLANGVITWLLVPMVMSLVGPRRTRVSLQHDRVPGFTGVLVRLFGFGRQRMAGTILTLTVVLCGFFIYQASKLYVTNDPFSYFRSDRALISDAKRLQEDLAGVKVFFVALESSTPRAFLEPANVDRLVELQEFIARQGVFDLSVSVADHLALVNREFHGGDPEFHVTPRKRELIAQYLLFFHRRDLQGYLSHDLSRANILVRHNISDSRTLNAHIAELKAIAARVAGADMSAHVVGENLMVNAAADDLIGGQARSLALLVLVIFIIMSVMFTSLKGGMVALVPSLVPIILMYGVMGLLDIPLNPGTVMVAVIAVGIAIDGTVHLFSRYNELSRSTGDNEQAVRITVGEEAVPVVANSLALALGFSVLLLSNFTIIAQFGALAAATMLFSVYANLLLTPIIMSRIRLVGLYDILAMGGQNDVLRESPLFRDMSAYQVRKAILISRIETFAPGALLLQQDTLGRSMYLLLSGEVDVLRHDGGEARHIARLGAGTLLGEVGYVREIQRTADVRAVSEVQALRFDYERMRRDLRYFPGTVAALNFNISRILGERLADAMGVAGARSDARASGPPDA